MRGFKWGGGIVLGIALLLGALLWLADTGVGHRFIVDRIGTLATKSGLRFKVGRIDGSIYSEARLKEVQVFDPKGLVFDAPDVKLDWRPFSWLAGTLDIEALEIDLATLHKLPQLNPTQAKGPILPDFDIRIGHLTIDRLRIEPSVAGERRIGRVAGSADIRSGRAMIDLNVDAAAGDRLVLRLDAEPDRDRFDIDARLDAPAGGVFGAMIGTRRPVTLRIAGDGRWQRWKGRAYADASGLRVVDLALTASEGRYTLDGELAPALVTQGKVQRLTAPRIRTAGTATLQNRRLDLGLTLDSAALGVTARGVIDLAQSRFDGMRIDARLRQPQALFTNMRGTNIKLGVLLDGQFDTARFDYLLSAPQVFFDRTGLVDVRASGRGRLSRSPVDVPIKLTARQVTGVGDVAGGILRNLSVEGILRITSKTITGDGLRLRSDKLTSRLSLFVDLVTGRYDVGLQGQLTRYLIPGLGIVDVKSELNVVPGPNGRGTRVTGKGQAWVRRFDNAFLAGLAGGLPYLETGLERGPDGVLRLINLRIVAPKLRLAGNGYRRVDGSFHFEGAGVQSDYGPLRLVLDGAIDRPKLDLLLQRPVPALGLSNVRLLLDPTAQGFAWRANGGSAIGAFTGNGSIFLPRGANATIAIADLEASGLHARGSLQSLTGGFAGRLALDGSGISGTLDFAPQGGIQRIEAHLNARDAALAGPPRIAVRRGKLDGVILLDPKGLALDGTVTAQGAQYGNVSLARLSATGSLRGGTGQVRAAFAGSRGRAFDLQTVASISPDRISLTGEGTIDRRPVKLTSPAVLTREGSGWRLAQTRLTFAGGTAQVAGLFADAIEVDATLERMPLTILDIVSPTLALGGTASGKLVYRDGAGLPTGRADLRVRNLSRAGLVLSSKPVDAGVTAVLTGNSAAMRAVAVSGGQTIGRAQARLSPLGEGDLATRLTNAPLFAQVRYNGPVDTLWRLTGIDTLDISGPVAIGADISGRLNDPRIRGSLKTANARIESPVSGTVLSNVQATGRFGGSRLVLDSFTARAGPGTVTGRGVFDLASARGFGMNLTAQADNAELLARDDIGATVTGPLAIRSDGSGGVLSGNLLLNRSRFRLGQTSPATVVPRLKVVELNRRADLPLPPAPSLPWRLDIKARAPNRLMVTGLGIESEWRADLDIGGTIDSPAILGRADLVRGDYEFAGKTFELERGVIRFQGQSPPDPVLDIVAEGDAQGLSATIRVTGTGQRPEITFASIPALPQDELLSRLLFGTSITNLSAPEALQLAAAVASLQGGGEGLNPINTLRKAIGLDRLRILPGDTTTGRQTSVAVGKYITRRTYVEIITDGQGYSATRAEFQITRWLSLLATISTIGRQSAAVRVSKDY